MPPLSVSDLLQFISLGGSTGVLALVVWLFVRGVLVTGTAAQEHVEIVRRALGDQLDEVRRQRDELWTLAQRTQGSQLAQASATDQAAQAIAAALQKLLTAAPGP